MTILPRMVLGLVTIVVDRGQGVARGRGDRR